MSLLNTDIIYSKEQQQTPLRLGCTYILRYHTCSPLMDMVHKKRNHPAVIGAYKGTVNGHEIQYIVKRSARSRYARIEFRPDTGLSVVIPRSYAVERVPELLHEKRMWISRHITKYQTNPPVVDPVQISFGKSIPFLGRDIEVIKAMLDDCSMSIELIDEKLIINCEESELQQLVEKWYRQQLMLLLKRKLDETCELLGVKYKRLTIRGQKTRWGSCSRMGTLSFNWRLMMFDEPVIDYVVLHELAHVKEMNHSKKFWQIVERYCPDYHVHRKWLRLHGQRIAGLSGI